MMPQKCSAPMGHEGDCYRTCLAMILNVPSAMIPNFAEVYKDLSTWHDRVNDWLRQYGLVEACAVMNGMEPFEDMPRFVNNIAPNAPAILSGETEDGRGHSVVIWNGEIFNPALDNTPLVRGFEAGENGWWITWIAAGPNFKLLPVEAASRLIDDHK